MHQAGDLFGIQQRLEQEVGKDRRGGDDGRHKGFKVGRRGGGERDGGQKRQQTTKIEASPRKIKREHALAEARQLEVAKTRQVVVGRPTWELDGAKRWGDVSDNFSKTYLLGKELQENSGWLNEDEDDNDRIIRGEWEEEGGGVAKKGGKKV